MAKNGTTWVKGQSGNPSGRRKEVGPVRQLAKKYTEAAIKTLAEVMEDAAAPHNARVAAAEALLARAWGRPQQSVDLAIEQQMTPADLAPDLAQIYRSTVAKQEQAEQPESTPPITH